MKIQTVLTATGLGSALLFWGQSRADVLEMKNKSVLHGEYQGGTNGSVSFKMGDQVQTMRTSNILAITFGTATNGAKAAASRDRRELPAAAQGRRRGPGPPQGPGQPLPTAPTTIPAGTVLT